MNDEYATNVAQVARWLWEGEVVLYPGADPRTPFARPAMCVGRAVALAEKAVRRKLAKIERDERRLQERADRVRRDAGALCA